MEYFVKKYYGATGDRFDDVFETVEEDEHGDIRLEDFKKEFDIVWEYHQGIEQAVSKASSEEFAFIQEYFEKVVHQDYVQIDLRKYDS